MALLRVAFFEFLIVLHVISAAALFRRFFPRESPWFGFVVPITALVAGLNFFEHFVALPSLGWLLPFSTGLMIWNLLRPGYLWDGFRFPCILFVIIFTWMLLLRCIIPDVVNYTEGAADLTRVLNYCLGEKVPPTDSWMPPYDSGGYYSFQHYGASVLKRFFSVDIGTALNLSFALLMALLCQMGAAVAYSLTNRKWIAVATILVLLAGSTGSAVFILLSGHLDYSLSTALNTGWDNTTYNPLWWICAQDQFHPDLTMVAPTYVLYCPEFHANLGATFLTMAAILASVEAYRLGRFNWPWICLITLPAVIMVTSAWFFLLAAFFCAGGLGLALAMGRRPRDMKLVAAASGMGILFIWPSFVSLSANPYAQGFVRNSWEEHTPLWMFLMLWWPVLLPWAFLCCVWRRLDGQARWFLITIPLLYILMEFFSLSARSFTVQKMWGDLYGIALITLLPLVFARAGLAFRFLSLLLAVTFLYCGFMWMKLYYYDDPEAPAFAVLSADHGVKEDPQKRRILQVLSSLHGATILPGKSYWAYNLAPSVVTLSQNRCFVAYTFQEEQYGHGGEINFRSKLNDDFYAGTLTQPLPFLHAYDIAAVMIWPEDKISDDLLHQIQNEIGSEYYYVDCKMGGTPNAGVFMRQAKAPGNDVGAASTSLYRYVPIP